MYNDLQHFLHAPSARPGATTLQCSPFATHQLRQNRLLEALPDAAWERLRPQLELVALPLGATLQEPGATLQSAFFPTTAIVSLMCSSADGGAAEIAVIGREGVLGTGPLLGSDAGPARAMVRGEGHALRIDAAALKREFDRCGPVMQLLLRYTQTLIAQMAQTAVCNRHHTVEQQLARWLLASLDRSSRPELAATHELIAGALGVRREGVTQAAGRLRRQGLIDCSRGRIEVLDRRGLEAHACECYAVVKGEMQRLLPDRADG